MCRINDRINRTERVDDGNALPGCISREVGNKQATGPVFLGRQRAFSQVEWEVFEESAEVIERLRLSAAEGINRHAKTRGPLIGKRIMHPCAAWTWATNHLFLLPSHTEKSSNVLIEAPGVLSVGSVVIRVSGERGCAKLRPDHLKANWYVGRCTISQSHREKRKSATGRARAITYSELNVR